MNEWLKSLMQRGTSLLWDRPVVPIERTERTAVHADSFDELSYEMIHDAAPNLRRAIDELAQDHDYVNPAYADLFQMLNQADPLFKSPETMLEGYDANHQILSTLADTEGFQDLRKHTVHDEWGTAFAMLSMQDQMRERFEQVREAREAQQQAQQQAQQAQIDLAQALAQAQEADNGTPGIDPIEAGQQVQQAAQQAQAAQQQLQEAQVQQEQATAQAGGQLAQAAEAASGELDEQKATAAAYGVQAGELERMSYDERRELTSRLDNDKLTALAKLVGQFRRYGDAERRRRVKHAPSVIVDVELGNDLNHLVNEEFNRLAIPELEDLFWMRYAQGELMQWLERGPERAGKGPILVVCDESGSMATSTVGVATPEAWSKALSLALSDQAKRDGRDFIYVGFSNAAQQWERRFPGGQLPLDGVIDFVSHFYNGGTAYEPALRRAMEIVKEYGRSEKGQPDVVFITDDQCKVPKAFETEWAEVRKALDMTAYGIQIGPEAGAQIKRLCDKTIQLSALNSTPEGMQELFRTI